MFFLVLDLKERKKRSFLFFFYYTQICFIQNIMRNKFFYIAHNMSWNNVAFSFCSCCSWLYVLMSIKKNNNFFLKQNKTNQKRQHFIYTSKAHIWAKRDRKKSWLLRIFFVARFFLLLSAALIWKRTHSLWIRMQILYRESVKN